MSKNFKCFMGGRLPIFCAHYDTWDHGTLISSLLSSLGAATTQNPRLLLPSLLFWRHKSKLVIVRQKMGNKEMSPIISKMVFHPFGPSRSKIKIMFFVTFSVGEGLLLDAIACLERNGPFFVFFFVLLSTPEFRRSKIFEMLCIA